MWSKSGFLTLRRFDRDNNTLCGFIAVIKHRSPRLILASCSVEREAKVLDELMLNSVEVHTYRKVILIISDSNPKGSWLLCCVSDTEASEWESCISDLVNHPTKLFLPLFLSDGNMATSLDSHREEFNFVFFGGGKFLKPVNELRTKIFNGVLGSHSVVRSVVWRYLLGTLPTEVEDWIPVLCRRRKAYEDLRSSHLISFQQIAEDLEEKFQSSISIEGDLKPMELLINSKVTENQIKKDIDRTQISNYAMDMELSLQDMMLRILLVWSLSNEYIGYVQGMNELVAIILLVFKKEYIAIGSNTDTLSCALSLEYLEHDAFVMLDVLLKRLTPIYSSEHDTENMIGLLDQPMPLPSRLFHIQHVLLQHADPELAAFLHQMDVEPHMYLIPWVRLMLCRAFSHLNQVCIVWDAVFSCTSDTLTFVDAVSTSILVHFRQAIQRGTDCGAVLNVIKRCTLKLLEDDLMEVLRNAKEIHEEFEVRMESMRKKNRFGAFNKTSDEEWFKVDFQEHDKNQSEKLENTLQAKTKMNLENSDFSISQLLRVTNPFKNVFN